MVKTIVIFKKIEIDGATCEKNGKFCAKSDITAKQSAEQSTKNGVFASAFTPKCFFAAKMRKSACAHCEAARAAHTPVSPPCAARKSAPEGKSTASAVSEAKTGAFVLPAAQNAR